MGDELIKKLPPKIFGEDQELHATTQKKRSFFKILSVDYLLGEEFQGWAQKHPKKPSYNWG